MPSVKQSPTPGSLSGTFIESGRLLLLDVIGTGSFGEVYKAVDSGSQPDRPKFYAVKVMRKEAPGTSRGKRQSLELSTHQDVADSPNVVGVYGVSSDDNYIYMILEYCSGGDLHTVLRKHNPFIGNNSLVKKVFLRLLDAIEHCHDRNVFHRDLKPENILLSKDYEQVLLADFGLASTNESSRDFGCGSKHYMSPECMDDTAQAKPYSHRANDIWSLGIILCCMISGLHPWQMPHYQDPCFQQYIVYPNRLHDFLDISDDAFRLLRRIFELSLASRIGLTEFKQAVVDMPSFFPSGTQIRSPPPVKEPTVDNVVDDLGSRFDGLRIKTVQPPKKVQYVHVEAEQTIPAKSLRRANAIRR